MDIETVVRQVTVKGSVQGMDTVTASYNQAGAAADSSGAAFGRSAASAATAEAAINKLGVQLQANFAQQQQFNQMIAQQGAAMAQAAAANDNAASSYNGSAVEIASLANHLRQASEAAYAFSPAFRSVVNGMAAPALSFAGTAIAAVATGMVTATNLVGAGLVKLATSAEAVLPALAPVTGVVATAGAAMAAFSPSIAAVSTSILGIAGSIVSKFLPVVGQILLVYDAVKMLGEAWTLGGQQLQQYVDLSTKAASLNVSTDFLQRLTKGAEDAKVPVDTLTTAITNMENALAPKLGGSSGIAEIEKLISYGNFSGNTGVTALKQATNPEQQLAAFTEFYQQATDASQKLAALDVAKTIFGPDVAKNLALDDQYLQTIQARMADVSQDDLVKQDDIDRAVALKNEYDAAVTILEQRWHPIQDLLTQAGVNMQAAWVGIVAAIASAVDYIAQLIEKLGAIPAWFVSMLNAGATSFMNATTTAESRAAAEANYGITSDPAAMAELSARQQLASRMQNPANITAARNQTTTMSEQLRPDKSIAQAPDEASTGAWDRATGQIQKYIEVTNAASQSVDAGAAEQEKLKAEAQLTAAAMKDGTPITDEMRAKMDQLSTAAAAAAQALAMAKVQAQIKFNNNTSLLSQDDVQIANQLKTVYPDVATALDSVEASQMRVNTATRQMSSGLESDLVNGLTDFADRSKTAGQAFSDMGTSIVKTLDQMVIKFLVIEPIMRQFQSLASASGGILGLLGIGTPTVNANGSIAGAVGPTSVGGAPLVGLHGGGIVGSEATFRRYVHPAYFDDAPRFHGGGIAGDEVPIIARRGEGVFTAGQMAALGAMATPNINVVLNESATANGEVTQNRNSNGGIDLNIAVAKIAAKGAATSGNPLNKVLTTQLGAQQRLIGR